jgi:hypothetical protein
MRTHALVLLFAVAGCAADAPPRYTVQADVIAKSDLQGTWYFRQTVVGVPFTTGFTFIGEQGENELDKIKWDIQEEVLTARRSFEYVKGTEKKDENYLGAPVAAFKIKSHFDIVRDYNASTGEELNKIVENTERKWFERKFMHIDWSENLISNFNFLADYNHGGISAIKQDPAPYFVSDPKDPDAIRIERPNADSDATYLEITQKMIASPESVDFEDEKNVPLCWLEYATEDCNSQEIKVRNSFMKTTERDYEPLVYDDRMMEKFGYFTTERKSYDRQYGQTETGRVRFINRFNLWDKSLTDTTCTSDEQCGDTAPGRRCVKEIEKPRCALPFTERGTRKVVYYLNEKFPADLIPAAVQTADEYDQTFRSLYKTLAGKDAPGTIFTLCTHNPVVAGDPAECGPVGTHARLGDLRYNMLYWVDEPNSAHLLGYGPSSHDPETGETVQAYAFVYGAGIDLYAAEGRDLVRLVNGELAPDQFISGENVKAWVAANASGTAKKTYSQADVDRMAANMDTSWTRGLPRTPSIHKANGKGLHDMTRARSAALAQSQVLGADPGLASRRLSKLRGTDIEKQLANGEILLARGMDPRTSKVDLQKANPLSLVSPERARFVRRERRRLGQRGVDLMSTIDDAVLGYALKQRGKDPNEVWKKIREEVFRSTAEHEAGHSFGLRHNFAGSFDAMNYPKAYWDLRTANGHVPKPRYLDAESAAEQNAGISEYQYSSIMDYGAKFNSDIVGLGRYDRAALKFGYGQVIEVFNSVQDRYLIGALQATVAYGMPSPLLVDCAGDNYISVHYTKLPQLVSLDDRSDVHVSEMRKGQLAKNCAYPDDVDHDRSGHLAVPYKFCSDEFEGASPDCNVYDRGADVYEIAANAIDTYRNYYLFNNFKRDRLGFNPIDYLDRIYVRHLDALRSQMQFYALFRADFADEIPDDGTPANFWRSPDAWGPFTLAVTEGFNLLGEILTTPEPGPYHLYTQSDGRDVWQVDEYAVDPPGFTLDLPKGRYFATSWDYDSGYYWYERISHIGVFLDKVAALGQLTDPETWFLGADEASDVRQYAINYYRLFPRQMIDVWGAALTDRWDRLAPLWDGTAMAPRPIADRIVIPTNGTYAIDPQIGFSVQLYASALGLALIPATYDQSFLDSARIFLQGNGQQIDSSKPRVTFTDPSSGRIYVALSYKDGPIEIGIGARMIARANELTGPAQASYVQVLEVMRSLTATYADLPVGY